MGMEKDKTISNTTIRRLTKYYRYIEELDLKETSIISSYTLGKMMGISPSLIRQDFNAIGEFGRQGHGYNLDTLKKEIGEFLGINKIHNMIVIGAGNLGQTLANYDGFAKVGFPIKGLFDINPKLIGMKINGIEIIDLDQLNSFMLFHLHASPLAFHPAVFSVSSIPVWHLCLRPADHPDA